jgi:hypothetical protein
LAPPRLRIAILICRSSSASSIPPSFPPKPYIRYRINGRIRYRRQLKRTRWSTATVTFHSSGLRTQGSAIGYSDRDRTSQRSTLASPRWGLPAFSSNPRAT